MNVSNMISTHKSYFLVPALGQKRSSLPLGSVIADVTCLERINTNEDLSTQIDTEIDTKEVNHCSGKVKNVDGSDTGPYSTFRRLILGDLDAPLSSESEIGYDIDWMETRSFEPSAEFIAKAAADPAIKSRLETGDDTKAYVVTGVKMARVFSIIEIQKTDKEMGMTVFHGRKIGGPTVLAFQVKQLSLTSSGEPTSESYVAGAVLEQEDREAKYMYEPTELDGEDMAELGMEAITLIDGNGEECRVFIPRKE
ncbi:hypothetical protein GGI35DRAFT_481951 [Trichoderma velutinum]